MDAGLSAARRPGLEWTADPARALRSIRAQLAKLIAFIGLASSVRRPRPRVYLLGPRSAPLPNSRGDLSRSKTAAPSGLECGRDAAYLCRRVLTRERCAWHQILTHFEAADDDRFETCLPDEPRGHFDRLLVVACDRHADFPRIFVCAGHASCAYGVECTYDAGARQQLRVEESGAFLARLLGDLTVALWKWIAGVDDDFALV